MKKKDTNHVSQTNNGWKTCSRGPKYRGTGPCPVCWPASRKDKPAGIGKGISRVN